MLPSFFLAVDDPAEEGAFAKVNATTGVQGDFGIKVNLDLVFKNLDVIDKITKATGRPIFVDMKMWNGQRTMAEVITELAKHGVTMTNLYALSDSMMEKATATAREAGMVILGVTVLTHYDEKYCKKYFRRSLHETVKMLAKTALDFGCNGYILPGTSLNAVSGLGGIKFNPAVRPAWFAKKGANRQKQIMSPSEAIFAGADIVSCGSPVFDSEDPAEALRKILAEIKEAKVRRR